MNANSREMGDVHASKPADVIIARAAVPQAGAVTTYLRQQDVWPAPREADLAAFLGRSDATLFCALQEGRIVGTAGCARDGAVMRFVHFVVGQPQAESLAMRLISTVEQLARSDGAGMLVAQLPSDSQSHRSLERCGYEIDWEEADAVAGRLVNMVDLVKIL